jgi:hypothetical protein
LKKKMVVSDLRVCLGGLTPPFRASPKTANIVSPRAPFKKLYIKGGGWILSGSVLSERSGTPYGAPTPKRVMNNEAAPLASQAADE